MSVLRSIIAAVAALGLAAPAASAAEPWSSPVPVPGAPDAFPLLAFPSAGRGDVAWFTVTDDPAGLTTGAVVSAAGVEGARTLADGFNATALGAYGADRLVAAGTLMPSGVARAAIAFGSSTGALNPRPLPARGAVSSVRALATNAAGDVAVVTAECTTRTCTRQGLALVVRRARDFRYRRVATLAQPGTQVRTAAVAVNPRGDVAAAWEKRHHVYARTRTAGGTLSGVERLGDGVQTSISVALSPARRAVVAWGSQRVAEGDALTPFTATAAVRGPSNLRFHTARVLGTVARTGTGRYVAAPGVRASITDTRTTVAFTTLAGGRYVAAARDLDAVGRPGPTQQLSPPGIDAILGGLATGPSGQQVGLFITGRAGNDAVGPGPAATGLGASVRSAAAATFGAPETIAEPGGFVDRLTTAIDPAGGRTFVAWRLAGEPIQLASRAPVG